ncbi:MAG: aromatic ring-hydroxylating dioxygenase subunit alpha [Cyanobacteria bacterium P01_D01_bin.50]
MSEVDSVLENDWHAVACSKDCPPGKLQSVRLLGKNLVLWRGHTPNSSIVAQDDFCPHRGTALSLGKIVNDYLQCGFHGWQFDCNGKCLKVPASAKNKLPKAVVKTYACQEHMGLVWVCLGNPTQDVWIFPEWHNSDYRKIYYGYGSQVLHSSGFRLMENTFDLSHFSFVHENILGIPSQATIDNYQVSVNTDGVVASNLRFWQPSPDGGKTGSIVNYEQHIYRPLTLYTVKEFDNKRLTIFFTVTPVEETSCIARGWVAINYEEQTTEAEILKFAQQLYEQDRPFVESQRPLKLPIGISDDTKASFPREISVSSDRLSVAYRRWLKQKGVRFGVC